MALLNEIESYWSTRTEGYSEVNHKELKGLQKNAWLQVLEEQFPEKKKRELRILDIGTGPGFFPRILAERGYQVTAVDYTSEMLGKAQENAGELQERITFMRMDAQNLEFEDNSFDAVISRNLTWNLEKPEQAYREWHRVLKPGGKMINFDANWYSYLYDEEKRETYEQDRKNVERENLDDHYLCTDIDRMEQIALQMPLSSQPRPNWDIEALETTGFCHVSADTTIWNRVWSEEEKINYHSTPMFMIAGIKENCNSDNRKERITSYWTKRSQSFLEQRREELHSSLAGRFLEIINTYLPDKKKLKILDVGCGTGFFSILLAKQGHQVTGIDLTPDMIQYAGILAEEEKTDCSFQVMDAENLEFEDQHFDVIISRNLTWTLPDVHQAYKEWCRVLKPGGILLNFDADYGSEDCMDVSELPENHAHHRIDYSLMEECEKIKRQLPISSCARPSWDLAVLGKTGITSFQIDLGISKEIYIEKDEFYNPTPLFLICGKKMN